MRKADHKIYWQSKYHQSSNCSDITINNSVFENAFPKNKSINRIYATATQRLQQSTKHLDSSEHLQHKGEEVIKQDIGLVN